MGSSAETVRERLGSPRVDRRIGDDRWLVYERGGISVRIRCRAERRSRATAAPGAAPARAAPPEERVASWTATLERGVPTLRGAVEPLGLWPQCAPDETVASRSGLVCRPLRSAGDGETRSLTATVRGGLIVKVTAFDEEPEWETEVADETGHG